MRIEALRNMTPDEVRAALDRFSASYVLDWQAWLAAPRKARPRRFGEILRSWQATRPRAMRRLRSEAQHEPPYLDDLLESAREVIDVLGDLDVRIVGQKTRQQDEALNSLWDTFSRLTTTELASCVGITKAVLLLTDGRIGPALDSIVRTKIKVDRPRTCGAWFEILEAVGEDIAAFESEHGLLNTVVQPRFAHLAYGRLYDMIFGPGKAQPSRQTR